MICVVDRFEIKGRGVVVAPDFSSPQLGWPFREETVLLINGFDERETTAQLCQTHHHIRIPDVALDNRWRIAMIFPNLRTEDVPIGCEIWVRKKLRDELLQKSEAQGQS
ncbi:MAG: hypothetical protein KDC35_06465 [Acidobacteria bacterium]|nr:hypothetical protein [Acidobacteriota bacterium]